MTYFPHSTAVDHNAGGVYTGGQSPGALARSDRGPLVSDRRWLSHLTRPWHALVRGYTEAGIVREGLTSLSRYPAQPWGLDRGVWSLGSEAGVMDPGFPDISPLFHGDVWSV